MKEMMTADEFQIPLMLAVIMVILEWIFRLSFSANCWNCVDNVASWTSEQMQ